MLGRRGSKRKVERGRERATTGVGAGGLLWVRKEVNGPSLSQQDRAKWEFSSRFSDFDLKKAALPDK